MKILRNVRENIRENAVHDHCTDGYIYVLIFKEMLD